MGLGEVGGACHLRVTPLFDCLACFMSGLPCPLASPLTCSPPSLPSPFFLLWPVFLSLPMAPSSVPVCLSLQELPPSSVYQPWGSGIPGALTSATAPPPGSTRWPRRYQQPPRPQTGTRAYPAGPGCPGTAGMVELLGRQARVHP